jgi:hypothetical protein
MRSRKACCTISSASSWSWGSFELLLTPSQCRSQLHNETLEVDDAFILVGKLLNLVRDHRVSIRDQGITLS